jgi:hypothetical protein
MSADVLVLSNGYQLMNVASWQRAVELIYSGKAEALHSCDRELRSASGYAMSGAPIKDKHHREAARVSDLRSWSRHYLLFGD